MKENHAGTVAAIRAGGEPGGSIRDMSIFTGSQITTCGRTTFRGLAAVRVLNTP